MVGPAGKTRCPHCHRMCWIEELDDVEVKLPHRNVSSWMVLCTYCVKSYLAFIEAQYAQMKEKPVFIHRAI